MTDKTSDFSDLDSIGPSLLVAYFFCIFFGPLGIHQFYMRKHGWGLTYLLTNGLFLMGWIIDLFTLPWQVAKVKEMRKLKIMAAHMMSKDNKSNQPSPPIHTPEQRAMIDILTFAHNHGGKITVTEGVMVTGESFGAVEQRFTDMHRKGQAEIENHPQTGVVQYVFPELGDNTNDK